MPDHRPTSDEAWAQPASNTAVRDAVREAGADEMIEVDVRFPLVDPPAGTRREMGAYLDRHLRDVSRALRQRVHAVGGRELGRAFLNQSVRASVPASAVPSLESAPNVVAVRVPRAYRRD